MKRKLVALTIAAATIIGTLGVTGASSVMASTYKDRITATNTGTETFAPKSDQVIFHTDKETKEIVKSMFDPVFYATVYPDVSNAYGITDANNMTDKQKEKLWLHFWNGGIWAGRACNADFNASVYASAYGDLQKAYGSDIIAYYVHYAKTGKAENRTITTVAQAVEAGIPVYNPIIAFEKGMEGAKPEAGNGHLTVLIGFTKEEKSETPSTPSNSETSSGSNEANTSDTSNTPDVSEKPSNSETSSGSNEANTSDTSNTPVASEKPSMPTKPDELIEGRFWGYHYREARLALEANGIDFRDMPNYISRDDYKDTYEYDQAFASWSAQYPNPETYRKNFETARDEYYEEYNQWNSDRIKWQQEHDDEPFTEPEPVEPTKEGYSALYRDAYKKWREKAPLFKDYDSEFNGEEIADIDFEKELPEDYSLWGN